jgi:hypothetical protein
VSDTAKGAEGARVDKYSDEQAEHSRQLLGRDAEGAELAAHHGAPAHGTVQAGPEDDEAAPVAQGEGDGR